MKNRGPRAPFFSLKFPGILPLSCQEAVRRLPAGTFPSRACAHPQAMNTRMIFRAVSPFAGAGAALVMLALLVATIYFTWFDLQWVTFFAGILAAAVLSIVSRASRAEWIIARRNAQVAHLKSKLNAEVVLRRHADEGLAAVRATVHHLDETFPAMVAYVDADDVVRYHNRAFRVWLGAARDAIDGRMFRDLLAPGAWTDLEGPFREMREGRLSQSVRLYPLRSGARMRLVTHLIPQFGEGGRVTGAYLLQLDVTDPKEGALTPLPEEAADGRAIYANTLNAEITNWENVADRLREALDRDEFCLYSQRIAPLSPSAPRLPFRELLVRLREEEDNLMPPGTFLPLAEEHGLMPDLDRWVVRHLLNWTCGDPARQSAIYSLNVAVSTVEAGGFPEFVRAELGMRGLPGSLLCFELPEPEARKGIPPTAAFIEGLRAAGCLTSLCGFGRSLESFDLLRHLPVDFLKVDAGIVLRVGTSPVDVAKVKAIVRVARETRRKTIAECVEDRPTMERLRRLGIDYAQGFGVSRPQPLEAAPRSEHVLAAVD